MRCASRGFGPPIGRRPYSPCVRARARARVGGEAGERGRNCELERSCLGSERPGARSSPPARRRRQPAREMTTGKGRGGWSTGGGGWGTGKGRGGGGWSGGGGGWTGGKGGGDKGSGGGSAARDKGGEGGRCALSLRVLGFGRVQTPMIAYASARAIKKKVVHALREGHLLRPRRAVQVHLRRVPEPVLPGVRALHLQGPRAVREPGVPDAEAADQQGRSPQGLVEGAGAAGPLGYRPGSWFKGEKPPRQNTQNLQGKTGSLPPPPVFLSPSPCLPLRTRSWTTCAASAGRSRRLARRRGSPTSKKKTKTPKQKQRTVKQRKHRM